MRNRGFTRAIAIALTVTALGGGSAAVATDGNGCIDISSLVCYMFGLCDGGYYEYCDVSAPNPGASGLPWIITMPAPGPVPTASAPPIEGGGGPAAPPNPSDAQKKELLRQDGERVHNRLDKNENCRNGINWVSTRDALDIQETLLARNRIFLGRSGPITVDGKVYNDCTKPRVSAFTLPGAGPDGFIVFCDRHFASDMTEEFRQLDYLHELAHLVGFGHMRGANECIEDFLNAVFSAEIAVKCDLPSWGIPDIRKCVR